ncbi:glycosyltransferase [Lichenifustis flavocetrariae]|uniref:Glycosyltransferase n=1 Tax=Lichenifustis flavocetrariae TaxID=2949735 RepID=A0AA41Z0W3_9HYPH|nr:glycosyltransferase [Lichenifustis flavocetrariae]MCW6510800.1 glycosyltransferase [Lichenifustis flavocetrariae]
MVAHSDQQDDPLRVVHVIRAPLGGLFRHVLDLAEGQIARGHAVGLVADNSLQDARIEAILKSLEPRLVLGLSRVRIHRSPHPSDIPALFHLAECIRVAKPSIVHGHGSKGGALTRLCGFVPGLPPHVRGYTPHGGSLNYKPGTRRHAFYMTVERFLRRQTDLLIFESGFIASRYGQFVGRPPALNRVIHNGVAPEEFAPVEPAPHAADFVYVGELRSAKGVDILLMALARVRALAGVTPTLALVGSGPDRDVLRQQAFSLGLTEQVTFHGAMSARRAFELGRTMVVPSRAESLPYVVLEAAAATIPLVATNVGGIPEIFGPLRRRLIPADSVADLADALMVAWNAAAPARAQEAQDLARYVQTRFSLDRMVDSVLTAYREALKPPFPRRAIEASHPLVLSS